MTTEATGAVETVQTTETPAAAPAAPVVETKLTETPAAPQAQTPAAPAAPEAISYEPTGDAGLDVALAFVGKLGIKSDHPAMAATATGDFSLIKAHLATLGDAATGWEQMVALAEQAYGRQQQTKADTEAAVSKAVVEVAGSAEEWGAIKQWASENADPDEKTAINAMFDAGPLQARAAAMLLQSLYSKAKGTVVNPNPAIRNGSAGNAVATSNGPLNAREYHAAVQELRGQLGSRMDTSPEYAALRARLRV